MEYSKDKLINVKISKTTAKVNEKVNVCLELSEDIGFVDEANILIGMKNKENEKQIKLNYLWTLNKTNYFTCNIELEYTGLYYFAFKLIINNAEKWIKLKKNNPELLQDNSEKYDNWTITVYDKNFEVPDWAKGSIMYQIFVDRFYKSSNYKAPKIKGRITKKWGELPEWNLEKNKKDNNVDFFMGNLKGIEEKIPYLKNLGVKILYLSPICMSQSNHRYDIADYEKVDPYLGSSEDLKDLCSKAHRNGMKIILDGVFNHTGNDSKYFNEYGNYNSVGAYQSKKSEYYDWYRKNENGDFEYWWGFNNLPECDCYNKGWQDFIYGKNGVIDKWFKTGIDGLRLDVADELTDEFIENIRTAVRRNKKNGFIIGEVWENAIAKEKDGKQRKYLLGTGLDSVMNYPFTNAILKYIRFGDYNYFEKTINEIILQYPKEMINSVMNSLSTHDITRAITTLGGEGIDKNNDLIWDVNHDRKWQIKNEKLTKKQFEEAEKMFKLATIIQYFLPGNTCIYYGDEIGMYGYRDPFNRKCFDWSKTENELNDFFIKIGKIKNSKQFLKNAEFKIIEINEKILVFERYTNEKLLVVFLNRTKEKIKLNNLGNFLNGKIILKENFDDGIISEYGYALIEYKNTNKNQ